MTRKHDSAFPYIPKIPLETLKTVKTLSFLDPQSGRDNFVIVTSRATLEVFTFFRAIPVERPNSIWTTGRRSCPCLQHRTHFSHG